MLKKLLTTSGRRILKAIKTLSTRSRKPGNKKSQQFYNMSWQPNIPDSDAFSLSWSLPSLDAKSIDTCMTYVPDIADDFSNESIISGSCISQCNCHCDEHEENQRNENLENEMIF